MNISERLAVMESRVEDIADAAQRREEKQDEILEAINAIQSELARYKGFIGGVFFILSGMGMVLLKMALPVWGWIKGHSG